MNLNNELPFRMLACLCRALAHKIRTPLSVISNDLSYLQTIVPKEECQRGLESVRAIAHVLKSFSQLGPPQLSKITSDLHTLWREVRVPQQIELELGPALSEFSISCDVERLRFGFQLVLQMLVEFAPEEPSRLKMSLRGDAAARTFRLNCPVALLPESALQHDPTCFTDVFTRALNSDSPYPALLDVLLLAHGFSPRFSQQEGGFEVEFREIYIRHSSAL